MSLPLGLALVLVACRGELPATDGLVATPSPSRAILSAAWIAQSDQGNAWFGTSVSSAGDIDNDGHADLLVGAPGWTDGQATEGAVWLFLGSPGGPIALPAWTTEADEAGALWGWSVSAAGDVNGDDYADVIVGAPGYSDGQLGEGLAALYLGNSYGLDRTADWTVQSDQSDALLGASVSDAGDVNGDGFADVVVGAKAFSNGFSEEGVAYVFHGAPSGLSVVADWSAAGQQESAWLGHMVSTAGDVNRDGYDDVIVGTPMHDSGLMDEGKVSVYLGSASGLPAASSWSVQSDEEFAQLGVSVAAGGDVNGDGFDDVIAGAAPPRGRALLYLGGPSGPASSAAWTMEGEQGGSWFGLSVAGAGDVNGDRYADVIVGAPGYDGGEEGEGRGYLFLGSSTGLGTTAIWTAESDQSFAEYGASVSAGGDVNGDGFGDVMVGAPLYNDGSTDEGRLFVYPGGCYDDTTDTDADGVGDGCDACAGDDATGDSDRDGWCALAVDGAVEDCDDGDATVYPGAVEICDGLDNGCSGTVASAEMDADDDGWFVCDGDCADGDATSYPGALELCDGIDNACAGAVSSDESDGDEDGVRVCAGDCDDADATTMPGSAEVCSDLADNDCDGAIDEGCADEAEPTATVAAADEGCEGCSATTGPLPWPLALGLLALRRGGRRDLARRRQG